MSDPVISKRDDTYFVLQDEAMRDYFAACPGGLPEAPLIDWAWETFQPRHFVDVGAHVGTWALTFGCRGASVWAFEPNPRIFPLLRSAGILNGLDVSCRQSTWAIHQLAVANPVYFYDGILNVPHSDGGGGSLIGIDGVENHAVELCKLDDVIRRPVDLIKIDVEGLEMSVLRGGIKTIKQHKPRILFECWSKERGQTIEGVFQFLRDDLEYKITPVSWQDMFLAEPA